MLKRVMRWMDPRARLAVRHFAGTRSFAERYDKPLRIAHLTDQHVGMVTSSALQRAAIEAINESEPDLVVLTGDYVAHSLDYLDELEELLSAIEAPAMGVLGNHDHWSGPDEVRRVLRRSGVEVLDNVNTVVELGGRRLQVVGIDDAYTDNADIEKALKGLDPTLPTLGLSHIAEEADHLWNGGVSLVLSGHTHSGQITVGDIHRVTLGKMGGHKYVHGLYGCRHYDKADGAVYVSAGIGAAVFGLRLGERGRPEVALFELGAAPGELDEHHAEQEALAGRVVTERVKFKRRSRAERLRRAREHRHRVGGKNTSR